MRCVRRQLHEALAVLHRASGQRCTTWAAVCHVLRSFADHFGRRSSERQTSAFVKAMQSILKDDLIERSSVSPRTALEQRSSHLSSLEVSQGLCRPLRARSTAI
jgi:hypothetical protein